VKYLLVLAVVLIAFWLWRSNRERESESNRTEKPPPGRPGPDPTKAIEMVSCDVCGTHCPQGDAVVGRRGVYCSVQHRGQAEP